MLLCASSPKPLSVEDSRPAIDRISQADAYLGNVSIDFQLKNAARNLNIDFTGGAVSQVLLNGNQVALNYNGFFIKLPSAALLDGADSVEITYSH